MVRSSSSESQPWLNPPTHCANTTVTKSISHGLVYRHPMSSLRYSSFSVGMVLSNRTGIIHLFHRRWSNAGEAAVFLFITFVSYVFPLTCIYYCGGDLFFWTFEHFLFLNVSLIQKVLSICFIWAELLLLQHFGVWHQSYVFFSGLSLDYEINL